jgi:alpha-tubulin suppressor-like RCC1 family protein
MFCVVPFLGFFDENKCIQALYCRDWFLFLDREGKVYGSSNGKLCFYGTKTQSTHSSPQSDHVIIFY